MMQLILLKDIIDLRQKYEQKILSLGSPQKCSKITFIHVFSPNSKYKNS